MPAELVMPRLSDTMAEGTVARWLKKEGDSFTRGEPLAEIDTDKATMPLEAFQDGRIEKILVQEGQTVPIGESIAILGTGDGASASATGAGATSSGPSTEQHARRSSAPERDQPSSRSDATADQGGRRGTESPADSIEVRGAVAPAGETGGQVKASPLARRIAAEMDVDLASIVGSGPGGRILREDVERAASVGRTIERPLDQPTSTGEQPMVAAPTPVGVTDVVEHSRLQAIIAKRMVESKTTIPHFYVTSEIDMAEAMAFRRSANRMLEGSESLSVNNIVLKAVALALRQFPDLNASYRNGNVERHGSINVGFAVAVPDGLFVPVVADCDRKSLRQIAVETKQLVEKTRAGRLARSDYETGTFSVSNLGMFDVTEFAAIVNPPQVGILAVGSIKQVPVVTDGQLTVGERMFVTLSCDHRVVYGATAAQFLQELRKLLENPLAMVI